MPILFGRGEALLSEEVQCEVCFQVFPILTEVRDCSSALCPISPLIRRARFPVVDLEANRALDQLVDELTEKELEKLLDDEEGKLWSGVDSE
jgi:hypothetical protein